MEGFRAKKIGSSLWKDFEPRNSLHIKKNEIYIKLSI